jgi:Ni,Fe-hydrogenase I cytochrome b subunit
MQYVHEPLKVTQLNMLGLFIIFCIMTVTKLYKFTTEGLTLLSFMSSHNIMNVPNANLYDLHFKHSK